MPPRPAQVHLHVARLSWPGASAVQVQALVGALPSALGGLLQDRQPPVNQRTTADRIAAAVAPEVGPRLGTAR